MNLTITKNAFIQLILFATVYFAFTSLFDYILVNDQLYFDHFAEKIAYDRIEKIIEDKNNHAWLKFTFVFIYYAIKFSTITLIIITGLFLWDIKSDFVQIFKVIILAEGVFVINLILKFVWFGFINRNYSLADLQEFSPFTLLSIMDISDENLGLHYILTKVNLFELAYIFLLAYQLHKIVDVSYSKSLKIIISSYGVSLALWITMVVFLLVLIS